MESGPATRTESSTVVQPGPTLVSVDSAQSEAIILDATGRVALSDALQWVVEGRRLRSGTTSHLLLEALSCLSDGPLGAQASSAMLRLVRTAVRSDVDTSVDLLALDSVTSPDDYRRALEHLATFTATRTLRSITAEAVAAAQADNALVIPALCQVAGLSYRDLTDRTADRGTTLPGQPWGSWSQEQVAVAFSVVDEVVGARGHSRLPGSTPARPVELLMPVASAGWTAVEAFMRDGVPYELLLTQRAVGGAWLAHRNSTATLLGPIMGAQLCERLDSRGVAYWRGTVFGGDLSKRQLGQLVGREGEGAQVGLVTRTASHEPSLAIAIAVARDGGTARKTAGKLLQLPGHLRVPAAIVLLGPGWSERGETAELVPSFGGRLFTERSLDELATLSEQLASDVAPPVDTS